MNPVTAPAAPAAKSSTPPANDASRTIVLHVDELVLHGFPAGDRHRIGEAFERELTRLITERGALSSFHNNLEIDRLPGGAFQFNADARPESTGIEIARAVFGGLPR